MVAQQGEPPGTIRLSPIRTWSATAQKQPKAKVLVFRSADPNSLYITIGDPPTHFIRADIKGKRIYKLPAPIALPKRPYFSAPVGAETEVTGKTAKYEAVGIRVGDCLSFSTNEIGKVEIVGMNEPGLYWEKYPLSGPYDPFEHDEVSVIGLKKSYRQSEPIAFDVVNKSAHEGVAQIVSQVRRTPSFYEDCYDQLGNDTIDHKFTAKNCLTLPAHSKVHHVIEPSPSRTRVMHFKRGHTYRLELMGSSALEGGGKVYYSTPFRIR